MSSWAAIATPRSGAWGQIGHGARQRRSSASIRITGTSTSHVNMRWPARDCAITNGEKPNTNPPTAAGTTAT